MKKFSKLLSNPAFLFIAVLLEVSACNAQPIQIDGVFHIAAQEGFDWDEFDQDDEFGPGVDGFDDMDELAPFQSRDFEDLSPAEQAVVICIVIIIFAAVLAITIAQTYFLFDALRTIPPDCQQMSPGLVWLMLIPCFNLVWIFFVYIAIPNSFESYFTRTNNRKSSYGLGVGIAYCVCVVLMSIPCLNYCTAFICGPACLILIIIYDVQIYGLKTEVRSQLQPAVHPPVKH